MRARSTAFAATVLALVFVFSAPAAADKPVGNQGWDRGSAPA